MDDLYSKLREYSIAESNKDSLGMSQALEDMQNLTANMDEGTLSEYVGMLAQNQSLLDSGMSEEDVQKLFPEIAFSGQLVQQDPSRSLSRITRTLYRVFRRCPARRCRGRRSRSPPIWT